MSAKLLDGKLLAQKLKDELRSEIRRLQDSSGDVPHMINVMIGEDPGACSYANSQKKVAEYVGIKYDLLNLPSDIAQDDLISKIDQLNQDARVHGIMLHKPVPKHINYAVVANQLDMRKDVEGINIANIGKMMLGKTRLIPCTPASVMEHIKSTGVDLRGKEAVVVGHSIIVGKPLSLLLLEEFATVTICHIATSEAKQLQAHVKRADILVVAAGVASLIKGDWIKKGAVVIDVGINHVDSKIVGDVDFAAAQKRAAYITPVPGGVGPVTVVMLMKNGLEAFKYQRTSEVRANS